MSKRFTIVAFMALCVLALAACGSSSGSSSTPTSSSTTGAPAAAGSTSSAAGGSAAGTGTTTSSGPLMGFEGVPIEQGPLLAPASTTGTGEVDGIKCAPIEQLVYHIHAHLAVFDNGRLYALPTGVGIPGSKPVMTQYGPVAVGGHCYYWLHTHTQDGVIHIESPKQAIYTLGNFFDEWHQPLSGDRVASLHGQVTAFVNGTQWKKSPRDIPLLPHEDIQFDIGDPIPPLLTVNWSNTQL